MVKSGRPELAKLTGRRGQGRGPTASGRKAKGMNDQPALTPEEAFELLALLVTSARGLVGEPREYGPRRFLRAVLKLAGFMLPRVDEEARLFLRELHERIERLLASRESDEQLGMALDVCCEMVAKELVRQALHQDRHEE